MNMEYVPFISVFNFFHQSFADFRVELFHFTSLGKFTPKYFIVFYSIINGINFFFRIFIVSI